MSKKITYAYKVVRKQEDGKLVSAVMTGPSKVTYEMGRVHRPNPNSLQFLFVFDKLSNARKYTRNRREPYLIFKAEVIHPTTKRQLPMARNGYYTNTYLPQGTRFVDSVKLIKQL